MFDQFSSTGIQVNKDLCKVALIERQQGKYSLSLFDFTPSNVKQFYMKANNATPLACSIDSRELLTYSMFFPQQNLKLIKAMLRYQIEPLLPYPIEEAQIDFICTARNNKGSYITAYCTQQQQVEVTLKKRHALGLKPDKLLSTSQGICHYLNSYLSDFPSLYNIDIQDQICTCSIIKGRKVHSTRAFTLLPSDTQVLLCSRQVKQSYYYFTQQNPSVHAEYYLLTGDAVNMNEGFSFNELPLFTLPVHPTFKVENPKLLLYATPVGLALSLEDKSDNQINFLSELLPIQQVLMRAKKKILCSTLLAVLFFISTLFFFQNYLSFKEDEIKELNKSISIFEKNSQNLLPETFSLSPTVPGVRKTLQWLNKHPQIISKSEEKTLLQIQHFRYQLLKFPHLGKKDKSCEAKVDLEFTAQSPRQAREFHDALIKSTTMIQKKKEITWDVRGEKYFTSFYLKESQPGKKGRHA